MRLNELSLVSKAAIGAVIVAAVGWRWTSAGGEAVGRYRTAPVVRGDLDVSISATGTVEPEELIDVGAQVAGQILEFGKNDSGQTVDYGVEVEAGTTLAQIDPEVYASDVKHAEAELARAQADVLQLRAKLAQAERDWRRAEKLGPSEALSPSAFDAYKAGFEVARANLSVGDAAVLQAEAVVSKARRNLGFTTIRSPVKGVIIDRRVNIGQTVVASLNAPSLFLIAKDLRRMEVWVSVNEADVGSITTGQRVRYTVDAFPGETFEGRVEKIRLNASMSQNVVTYTVEVSTDNSTGRLLPYLTANVQFEIAQKSDVLLVPSAALRFKPSGEGRAAGGDERPAETRAAAVWILSDGAPKRVAVDVGATSGATTEIRGEGISEGLEVIVGETVETTSDTGTKNPFAPTMPRGGRRR